MLREAAEAIVAAMAATVAGAGPGTTKHELAERLREQEELRGVAFDYCLTAMGTSMNRAPSDQPWRPGDVLSLDSGGERDGYIGDLCRMAVLGAPSAEADAVLAEVRAIQDAARVAVGAGGWAARSGRRPTSGAWRPRTRTSSTSSRTGWGSSPTSPRAWTRTRRRVARRRTTTARSRPGWSSRSRRPHEVEGVGFVKLEDTVVVTDDGWEAFGDDHRDWMVAGA